MSALVRLLRDERGATAIEYSMIAVIIAMAAVAGLSIIGPAVMDMLTNAGSAF